MGYERLFAPPDLAMLHDWLQETGELYVDLSYPHSGGSNGSVHFIRSLGELRAIVASDTHPEVDISIFRAKQYPIRGVADEGVLAKAMEQIPDGQRFHILSAEADPLAPCAAIGWGDCHEELSEEFAQLAGRHVWVGQNPFDVPPYNQFDRFFNSPDQVLVVHYWQHPEPRLSKNRAAYAPFEAAPDRYRPYIGFW
jgi:hypothetical protein